MVRMLVCSVCKADWDRPRSHLRDVPWLDILKHDATYAAKEITEWVEIGIDCYVPLISTSVIGMRLLKIGNCFVILVITVRKSSKMRGPIMPKQLVALLHLTLLDLVTTGGFASALLTGGSLSYLHFLMGLEVLTTSTDKANLC